MRLLQWKRHATKKKPYAQGGTFHIDDGQHKPLCGARGQGYWSMTWGEPTCERCKKVQAAQETAPSEQTNGAAAEHPAA